MAGTEAASMSLVGKVVPSWTDGVKQLVDMVASKAKSCPMIVFTTGSTNVSNFRLKNACDE